MAPSSAYRAPGWLTQRVFNRLVARLTTAGVSVLGSRVLEVRGRVSGQPRRTPVNLLEHGSRHYLVAPRGETQWVRNLRAADGQLVLVLGRRRDSWRATELVGDERVAVVRAYLTRWRWEVGTFFGGVGPRSDEDALRAEASAHPTFLLTPAP
ncbi:MAG: nitroreductase/quinone reductase family protein [Acidimicrobiales bacterium]